MIFGIADPWIWLAYLSAVGCLVFALWFGLTRWNHDSADDDNDNNTENRAS